jgi:3-deoxy-D-manno-octulosonate 8-phosphate phosphatase (KDO 8-P phosphatase)
VPSGIGTINRLQLVAHSLPPTIHHPPSTINHPLSTIHHPPSTIHMTNLLQYFQPVKVFVFDVDGVLTDGTLLILENGLMARRMHIKDGFALQLAVKKGYSVIIISGGNSPEVKERLSRLGVKNVYMQVEDKKALLQQMITENNFSPTEILYMGDDLPDLPVMQIAGLPCCPADAVPEIKNIARYISHLPGGAGCARDVIEKVLKLNNHWGVEEGVTSK